jgi:hypothetical protein
MEEFCVEGLATHGGPESCVDDPRGRGEALTGYVQAGLLSREIIVPGCRRRPHGGRQHCWRRYARRQQAPRGRSSSAASSAFPSATVCHDAPVSAATRPVPPFPSASAAIPSTSRLDRSSSIGSTFTSEGLSQGHSEVAESIHDSTLCNRTRVPQPRRDRVTTYSAVLL